MGLLLALCPRSYRNIFASISAQELLDISAALRPWIYVLGNFDQQFVPLFSGNSWLAFRPRNWKQ